jgi:hypothetical protein
LRDAGERDWSSPTGHGGEIHLEESKEVATHPMTEVPNALTRAMRVCEPKQEEGRNFIAIHISKVWQVQSNSNLVNPQQRKGNLRKATGATHCAKQPSDLLW